MEMVLTKKEKIWVRDPLSALTHFIGFLMVLPAAVGMLQLCDTGREMAAFLIFSFSLMLLYGASTIYHTLCLSAEKIAFLRRIDHMMIFVLIAGTYTPVCLLTLEGKWGTILLAAIWSIAIAGMFMKIFWMGAPRWLSTMIYVVMGWLSVTAFVPLLHAVGWSGFFLLLTGGIAYTVGALIYGLKKPNLAFLKGFGFHEIFHVFVMIGTAFHILFMFLFVLS
ncbi:MAG: hemolysin III family protein [Bacillota bacterium]|nr:hemolysin III family protein [Bacillota bacterium]